MNLSEREGLWGKERDCDYKKKQNKKSKKKKLGGRGSSLKKTIHSLPFSSSSQLSHLSTRPCFPLRFSYIFSLDDDDLDENALGHRNAPQRRCSRCCCHGEKGVDRLGASAPSRSRSIHHRLGTLRSHSHRYTDSPLSFFIPGQEKEEKKALVLDLVKMRVVAAPAALF